MKNKKIILIIISIFILIICFILLHYNDKKAYNECLKLHGKSYCKNTIEELRH